MKALNWLQIDEVDQKDLWKDYHWLKHNQRMCMNLQMNDEAMQFYEGKVYEALLNAKERHWKVSRI